MSQALYRKYRSKSLDEIVGQSHITDILSRALRADKVAHAYLLTGPRGVGKTSIARILAHEINKLPYDETSTHLDIIEIDAASNNGVEDVRALREKAQIAPSSASKKVYIIDEAHMLSKPAFNALLKTLEEPPAHVVFILATTDADKLPATIISRTQQFTFRAIHSDDVVAHLKMIVKKESIHIDDDALRLIATHGGGSFRDSISLLDQLSSLSDADNPITAELVETMLGLAPKELIASLLHAIQTRSQKEIISLLESSEADGISSVIIVAQLLDALRDELAASPEYSRLIGQLLEVSRSSQPSLKLLVTLLEATEPSAPVSRPLAAAPVPALAVEATKKKPHSVVTLDPKPPADTAQPEETPAKKPRKTEKKPTGEFNWDAFYTYLATHHVAIASMLEKCKHDTQDGVVKIYTGNAFYKRKLDDAKYAPLLYEALQETGQDAYAIETVASSAPIKDSTAAEIAAIMGGGEEVEL